MATPGAYTLDRSEAVSFIVIGASGDLALKKIFPALFALYCQELLPLEFRVVGFARTPMPDDAFRARIMEHLACRYEPEAGTCARRMDEFLNRCSYVNGQYDSSDDFLNLYAHLKPLEHDGGNHRVFYMAIPPFVFLDVARSLANAGLVNCDGTPRWSRAVIEKPFGEDRQSSDELVRNMGQVFTERQTFRIDHYLGKEVIQNLLVLRFANLIFDPIWNRSHIENVSISWTENIGVADRGGYFDQYGIIRDVMQNHLLQILALVAMEQPVGLEARYVRDEKVKVLRSIAPLTVDKLVLGQYEGYRSEPKTPADSNTPTFAAAVLHISNRRWDGVPFLMRAGKALNTRMTEIRIEFKDVPGNIFARRGMAMSTNEMIIRVQPDEGISLRIMNKVPGLELRLEESVLDLRYAAAFPVQIPDAYESLLLEVLRGDKSLFIWADELEAAWDIFTPVLHQLDAEQHIPEFYAIGSEGPRAAAALARQHGIQG